MLPANIGLRWATLTQAEVYRLTREPQPETILLRTDQERFHENSASYSWANEPTGLLHRVMDYVGKSCLAVTGPGDQPLVLRGLGVQKLLGFDICHLSSLWTELKEACVRTLTREDFLFFVLKRPATTEERLRHDHLYSSVRPGLSEVVRATFDSLLTRRGDLAGLLVDGHFFRGDRHPFRGECVPQYLSDSGYLELRGGISSSTMRVTWLDIGQALEVTAGEQFDVIYVSNIFDRWHLFGGNYTEILSRVQLSLARHAEARVIGHCDPAFLRTSQGVVAQRAIASAAAEVGMPLIEHCKDAPEYWCLAHG